MIWKLAMDPSEAPEAFEATETLEATTLLEATAATSLAKQL
jgi:hypothetical protein